MPFENIKIIDPYVEKGWTPELKLTLATYEDLTFLEITIKVPLPVGYKQYVTTLGEGEYCNFIRIGPPQNILLGNKKFQQFLDEN